MCAYLFMITGDTHLAEVSFNIYGSKDLMQKLYSYIIKRSIYEYYFSLKYNKDNSVFTESELSQIVNKIEKTWVENV